MSATRTSVVVVGVGGQGSVFVARVLGEAALRAGLGVVSSELHGMAQRGGVVGSTVILGDAHGPIVEPGEADLLVAFEPLEAVRALPSMRRGSMAVVGLEPVVPYTVSLGATPYPPVDALLAELRSWLGPIVALDLAAIAQEAGDRRASSAVALGALSALGALPLEADLLRRTTVELAPRGRGELGAAAFDRGAASARALLRPETAG